MARPLIVVSDVHLSHRGSEQVAADLARLIVSHPHHEIVLNGDSFSLSCDPRERDPAESATTMLGAHATLRLALRDHVVSGSPVTLLPGNHDTGVQTAGVRPALLERLELGEDAALDVEPWFVRRNGVHIEHGHVYDPDNAPAHPLAPPWFRSEPLGVALTRRFLGPHDQFLLAHKHEVTPLGALKVAFDVWGPRAPLATLELSAAGVTICAETAVASRLRAERRHGETALPRYAANAGMAESTVRALLDARPVPTHTSFRRTFMRFYCDRVLATLAIPAGVLAIPAVGAAGGAALSAAALAYLMAWSVRGSNRYTNRMPDHLRDGAGLVRRLTGAALVIFGHTHLEDEAEGYVNPGSFRYTERRERPYLRVDEQGRAERRYLPA